jgi:hypothetical protein
VDEVRQTISVNDQMASRSYNIRLEFLDIQVIMADQTAKFYFRVSSPLSNDKHYNDRHYKALKYQKKAKDIVQDFSKKSSGSEIKWWL